MFDSGHHRRGAAGARDAQSQTSRRPRGRGTAQSGQRDLQRKTGGLGWSSASACRPLYGNTRGHSLQPHDPDVLRPPEGGRENRQGCHHGLYAEVVNDPEYDGETPNLLGSTGGSSGLKFKTVAIKKVFLLFQVKSGPSPNSLTNLPPRTRIISGSEH